MTEVTSSQEGGEGGSCEQNTNQETVRWKEIKVSVAELSKVTCQGYTNKSQKSPGLITKPEHFVSHLQHVGTPGGQGLASVSDIQTACGGGLPPLHCAACPALAAAAAAAVDVHTADGPTTPGCHHYYRCCCGNLSATSGARTPRAETTSAIVVAADGGVGLVLTVASCALDRPPPVAWLDLWADDVFMCGLQPLPSHQV